MYNRSFKRYSGEEYGTNRESQTYESQILERLKVGEGASVLEFGAGLGFEADYLRKKFNAKVFELEASVGSLDFNSSNSRNLVLADYESLPFSDGTFEFVHSKDSYVHIPEKNLFFRELARVLSQEGQLLITTNCAKPEDAYTSFFTIIPRGQKEDVGYDFPFFDLDDLKTKMAELRNNGLLRPDFYVSPPYFLQTPAQLEVQASKAGFKKLNSVLPETWTPAKDEKNWGDFERKVFLFQK